MIKDASNSFYITGDLDHSIIGDHDNLPTLEQLLLNAGAIRQSERAGFGGEHKAGYLEHMIREDCAGVTTPDSRRSEKKGGSSSSVCR